MKWHSERLSQNHECHREARRAAALCAGGDEAISVSGSGRLLRYAPKKMDFAADGENGSKCQNNRDLQTSPWESPFCSTYPARSGFATHNDIPVTGLEIVSTASGVG